MTQRQVMLGSGAPITDVAGLLNAEQFGRVNGCALKLIRRMTLKIGGVSADDLAKRLRNSGHSVSFWARNIMRKPGFTTLPEPTEIELGWVTVHDLGFEKEPTTRELYIRIKEVGEVCPVEVESYLRIADEDQPRRSWYCVVTKSITGFDYFLIVFQAGRNDDDKRWLDAHYAGPEDRWPLDIVIVFVLRK